MDLEDDNWQDSWRSGGNPILPTPKEERCKIVLAKPDNVNHPGHYTAGGVECIDALDAATEGLIGFEAVYTANAIKYLWRWKRKNGKEDLKKAKWYLERLISKLEERAR